MDSLPLPTLLSQVLVAIHIELDNEFEHRAPHRTTSYGGSRSEPWLVSLTMYFNCLQFLGEEALTAKQMVVLAAAKTNFRGMHRWGYIVVGADSTVRPTIKGQRAREIWHPLFDQIEARWRDRFGAARIDELREALRGAVGERAVELPDCLPVLDYGLHSRLPVRVRRPVVSDSLPALLARALLVFALLFEKESEVSLAICADVLRVVGLDVVAVRELPVRSGVSKEAIAMALGFLQTRGFALVGKEGRTKSVHLTAKGRDALATYNHLLPALEERWRARADIGRLRRSLEQFDTATLLHGMAPYPDGWRAHVRKPEVLPHYPMVLHRGGFPDGS